MDRMSLLVTWVWPETPITIAVLVILGVAAHALISMGVSRATALALQRSAQHSAGRTSAASRLIGHATGLANARAEQRTRTLGSLLRSISGVVITETIFGWPGVGQLAVEAINHSDYPLIQADALVVAVIVVLLNLLVDLSYASLNPRIRLDGKERG